MATATQILARERTQYTILDGDGEPVENYHQDDSSDPIVADSLGLLVALAAEACDYSTDDFLEMMLDPNSDYGNWEIISERITAFALPREETLKKLLDDYNNDEDDDFDDDTDGCED